MIKNLLFVHACANVYLLNADLHSISYLTIIYIYRKIELPYDYQLIKGPGCLYPENVSIFSIKMVFYI